MAMVESILVTDIVVVGAVCRKPLHRFYVVLKEQRPYVIRD
jgi:hypothetical protein